MITITNKFADSRSRHFGIFLCQIHRYLSCHDIITLTALAVHGSNRYIIMMANRFNDIIDGERLIIHLHRTLDDALRRTDINAAVINDAVSRKTVDGSCKSRTLPLQVRAMKEMTSTGIFKPSRRILLLRISTHNWIFGFSNSQTASQEKRVSRRSAYPSTLPEGGRTPG